jgi:hypothetical protein
MKTPKSLQTISQGKVIVSMIETEFDVSTTNCYISGGVYSKDFSRIFLRYGNDNNDVLQIDYKYPLQAFHMPAVDAYPVFILGTAEDWNKRGKWLIKEHVPHGIRSEVRATVEKFFKDIKDVQYYLVIVAYNFNSLYK